MRNKIFNYSTLALVYFGFFLLITSYFKAHALVNSYTYVGLILMIVSLVFFTMARIKLDDSFQVSAEANNLVKSGIYKKSDILYMCSDLHLCWDFSFSLKCFMD